MAANTDQPRPMSYGFVAKAMAVVIVVWALAQGLWMVRDIAFIGFGAILLATFFSLAVDRLDRVIPRSAAAVLVLLVFLAALFGIGYLGWPALEGQVSTIREEVPRLLSDAFRWFQNQYDALMPAAAERQAERAAETQQSSTSQQPGMGAQLAKVASGALPLLSTAIGALTGLVVMLFAAVFLVIDPDVYLGRFIRLIPLKLRERVEAAARDAGDTLKRWIAGMAISMLVIFTASTVGLWLLGVPAPVALGMIAGILVFIPFIGPTLSAVPAMALAFTVSPTLAIWTGLLYLGIQLLESNLITPLVMREAVDLEPAATIIFQVAMGVLFGFMGLFLAVPLFAALQVLVQRLYVEPMEEAAAAEPA